MTSTQVATASAGDVTHVRRRLPPIPVVAAFVASRVLVYGTLGVVVAVRRAGFADLATLWDGNWYELISTSGVTTGAPDQSGLPFFPLLPGFLHAAHWAAVPMWLAGLVLVNVAFCAGLWGLYVLMRRDRPETVAAASVWCLALFGYGVGFALVYPDAIVLATSVWAFVLIGKEPRSTAADVGAALVCALAASARPNGILVAVAVGFTLVWKQRHWLRAALVCLPSAAVVGTWMAQLWVWTGDPLAFMTAKVGWHESTVLEILDHSDWNTRFHLGAALVAIAVVAWQWRKLEAGWLVLAGTYLVPSLALGIVGLGRYSNTVFPVFAAAGEAVAPRTIWTRAVVYTAGAVMTVAVTWNVLTSAWVP